MSAFLSRPRVAYTWGERVERAAMLVLASGCVVGAAVLLVVGLYLPVPFVLLSGAVLVLAAEATRDLALTRIALEGLRVNLDRLQAEIERTTEPQHVLRGSSSIAGEPDLGRGSGRGRR